jgi:hypothetical protein
MAIKFSQFNERTDHTSGMYLVGYDGNQNIHITVDNLFDDFINGTENTITMFGTGGTVLADSILSQDTGATILTVSGQLNVDAAATFDTSITVTGDSTLNGNVTLGDASADLITQTGTLYLNGPVKDTTNTLGVVDQVLLSDATGELTFTDLADLHVGGAEVVELPVKNVQGSALVKGDPVYISGSVGASGRLEVQLADASNTLKMPAVGLLKQDLANNAEGFAVVTGKLRNLITDPIDGVSPTENDVIYIKPSGTSGAALTTTKPVYGNFIQNIGKVGRVSTSNDGNFVVSSILRTNDIPNLTPGRLWVGSTGNTIESQTIFVDEATGEVGIGTASPSYTADIVGTLRSAGQAVFSDLGPVSVAQLGGGSSTTSQFNIISTAGGGSFISATNRLVVKANNKDAIEINNAGQLQFGEYGSGAFTGTVAKNLSIDSSGNVIETNPAVDGSGTLNYVTKWTPDGNSLGNSIIFDNGSQVAIGTTSPAASVKLHVEGALRVNGGNLNVTNTSLPIIYLNTSSSSTDNYALQNSGGNFQVKNNAGLGQIQFQILNSGQAKLDLYGQNTFTGTAAKNLSVTSSGAIIETDAVPANIVETITTTDGTYINLTPNTATDGAVTITADLSATDGTAAAGERYLTKNNAWATIASIPGTYTFNVTGGTGTPEAIASGATLDIAGGTNISTVVGLAADTVTVNLDDSISLTGSLTVGTTGSFTGQVTIPQVPSANTDAASKHYVDNATAGGLIYQGSYNANTNTPDLTSFPNSIQRGWTYTVTVAGTFHSENVEIGDLLIAEVDDPWALGDWTTVQNNVDLATLTTVGIGNVTAGTNIGVSYSNGTAQISNGITNNNQLTNGAGYLTSASLPTVNNGTLTMTTTQGLDGGASFTANQLGNSTFTVSLDLSELTDMTAGVSGASDELILLDSGAERRKRIGEINLGQFNNDLNWTSNTGSMSSWTIKEGNGNESTAVTNGETLTIAQGTGIQSEMTSTSSGGTITITNTAPDTGTPAILSNGSTPSLNTGISASEMRSLIGAGTGSGDITGVTAGSYMTGGGTSGTVTLNANASTSATANTLPARDGAGDITARLFRATYGNQSTISGAIAFRVNNGSDNYTRYCSSPSAIRTFIGAGTSSFSGSYNDLSNKPTIPTNNNQLTNGAGYITGYSETDTLSSVVARGSSTSSRITAAGLTATSDIRGNGQQLVLNAGESASYATGQTAEHVYLNAEGGVQIVSSPNNWSSGWAGRRTAVINDSSGNSSLPGNLTIASTEAKIKLTATSSNPSNIIQATHPDGTTSPPLGELRWDNNPGATGVRLRYYSGYNENSLKLDGSNFVVFSAGSTRMLINSSGNVGIGTTNPSSAKLQVESTTSTTSSGIVRLKSLTASSGPFIRVVDFVRSNNSTRGYIAMNQYSVQYNATSDYRLKRNVTPMENSIDRIKLLKPSRFNWVEGPDDYVVDGFIAHEVQDVVHDAVSGEKDAVDKNNEPAYQGIDQSKLVPLLTAALQDAITKIENLETRIQTLENN